MEDTHRKYPNVKLAQTETECNNGTNSWDEGMDTFCKIIQDTSHFANSYFYWNMILNESGRSTWNWSQDSLLTVDRKKGTVISNSGFCAMKHFSAKVLSGARRIRISGGRFKNLVAFLNPSGAKVLAFANETDAALSAELENSGSR